MKIYKELEDIFGDGIFERSDIIVFWGKRGKGKSSLMTKFCVDFMQPENAKDDVAAAKELCGLLNDAGITSIRAPGDHLVFVDTYAQSIGFGRAKTAAYETKLSRFGLPTVEFKPEMICPYGKYAFDETQKELDSHKGDLPINVSGAFEFSRHPRLFIMLAMQRPMRLPKDVRELATFVECVDRKNIYNEYGLLLKTVWTCNIIYNNTNLESYLNNRDPQYIDKRVMFEFEGNIYACYDPYYFLPMFYTGMENEMPVYTRCQKVEFTEMSFKHYQKQHTLSVDIEKSSKSKKKEKTDDGRDGTGA